MKKDLTLKDFENKQEARRKYMRTYMKIYEYKVFKKGHKIINILCHKSYKKKRPFYEYFYVRDINNITKSIKKKFVCVIFYDKFSSSRTLNRHLLPCNSMTK